MTEVIYDTDALQRHLYERSAILSRAAHALELAAMQLREAPDRSNCMKGSVDIRSAAMVALHGALGALELSGEYELAAFVLSASRELGGSPQPEASADSGAADSIGKTPGGVSTKRR
jgi:hypothetical protein